MSDTIENVLVLQGGGSLGAFGCGVFKALANRNIKIDIVAGTSIGGVNASIIAGSKNQDHPEEELEQFWLELAENNSSYGSTDLNFTFTKELLSRYKIPTISFSSFPSMTTSATTSTTNIDTTTPKDHSLMIHLLQIKALISFYNSAINGNKHVFIPRWRPEYAFTDPQYFTPLKWTHLYDHSPLVRTLEKFVDYNKLQPNGNPNSRLIITAVNVLTAEPLIFDSSKQQITPKHILATTGYPTYYFKWTEVEKGVYAWDGSLLSNTPLREVIDASPIKDKRIFLVENYPKRSDKLPDNLLEVQHRERDIMFSDKTLHNIRMSKVMTYHLKFIDELYHIIENNINLESKKDKEKFEIIRRKYQKIAQEHGAEIKKVYYITRDEAFSSLYENADFSIDTIKTSIKSGELKTRQILEENNI